MTTLVRCLYTLSLVLISPLLLWGLYCSRPNKPSFGERWVEHFGFLPKIENRRNGVIWLHAVSVGEVIASSKLIAELTAKYQDKTVLVTTTTSTGAEQVEKIIQNVGSGVVHRYMPIDFSWCVRRFLRTVKPEMMLIIETEIWPNTIHTVASQNIPIVLINGRLSEKSATNYHKLRLLIAPALKKLRFLLVVHEDDQARFIGLGVKPGKVEATGSLKYDITVDDAVMASAEKLRKQLGSERKVWIAASTHEGEDEQILAAYQIAKKNVPELLLILVPRHPERFDRVATLVKSLDLALVRRTQYQEEALDLDRNIDVYLADTMGEMMVLLAASDLVFMGGSLLGKKVGGHNFIEPAYLSKPIITGPSYFNFQALADELINNNALIVLSENDLSTKVHELSLDASDYGKRAFEVVNVNRGSLVKTLHWIDVLYKI